MMTIQLLDFQECHDDLFLGLQPTYEDSEVGGGGILS